MISSTIIPARLPAHTAGQSRLVIYFNGTFVNRENGAHVRVFDLLHWARRQFPGVIVYSYIDHYSCPWTQKEVDLFCAEFPDVELRLDRRPRSTRLLTRFKNVVCTLAPRWTTFALTLHLPGQAPAFEEIRRDPGHYFLLVSYVEGLTELNGVRSAALTAIETHDIKFLHYAKKTNTSLADLRVVGKFRSEVAILEKAGAVIAIAPPEVGMFRLWLLHTSVFYVPRYSRQTPVLPSRAANENFVYDLLFVGSENSFNVDGLSELFQEHGAWLAQLRIGIAGRVCAAPRIKEISEQYPNVSLEGYVADLDETYKRSKVVICPVEGTGLKIKVIEALAMGKPVLGSRHTLDGLPPGFENSVFLLTKEMTLRLVGDDDYRRTVEIAAQSYARVLESAGDLEALRTFIADRLRNDHSAAL